MSMTCPVHGPQKLRQFTTGRSAGKFYCAQFVGLGIQGANDKGYCNAQAVQAQAPPGYGADFPAPPPPAPAPAPSVPRETLPASTRTEAVPHFSDRDQTPSREDVLRMQALEFAGRIYAGGVPISHVNSEFTGAVEAAALNLADRAFVWLLGRQG